MSNYLVSFPVGRGTHLPMLEEFAILWRVISGHVEGMQRMRQLQPLTRDES
jgi:hypothetical protein